MRFFILMLFSTSVWAGDWTTADTIRQGVFTGLMVLDWGQTRWIAQHNGVTEPDKYPRNAGERNPLLGQSPSLGKVNNYFAISIVTHVVISYMLPPKWREGWQYVSIGFEAGLVRRNHSIGIKMSF